MAFPTSISYTRELHGIPIFDYQHLRQLFCGRGRGDITDLSETGKDGR